MGLEEEDWEALDVDDSDLSSFLRPCKRPHSQTLNPIPGPAGIVQAAMKHRRSLPSSEEIIPTQDFIRQVVQNGHQSDHDFNANPWLSALQFLPRQGMKDATPLSSIKKHINVGRVHQVVAVIESCKPIGLGDMMVTLKDPTDTIDASVHRKVFSDGQFRKDITVGSVLVLQKVVVFSPTRSTCYLNITLQNIVKVFSKGSAPPSQQIYSGFSERCTTPSIADETHQKSRMLGNTASLTLERTEGIMTNLNLYSRFSATERHENSLMPGNNSSLPQVGTEDIMTNLRSDSRFREVADVDEEMEENLVLTSYHSDHGNDSNQNTVSNRENISLEEDSSRPLELTCGGELQSEMKEQPTPPKLGEGDNLACSSQGNRSSTKSFDISDAQETGLKKHLERHREIINPTKSIPHWTEEQLDELLAFD